MRLPCVRNRQELLCTCRRIILRPSRQSQNVPEPMMKTSTLLAVLALSFTLGGCQTAHRGEADVPVVTRAAAQEQETHGGQACAKCGCVHFEAQSDAAAVCRMCGHGRTDHTRPESTKPGQ